MEVLTPKKTTTGRKRARVEEKTVSFEEPVTPTPVDMATPAPAVPALDVAALSQEVATAVGALVAGHLEEVANLVKASNAAVHDAVEECVGGNKTREALEAPAGGDDGALDGPHRLARGALELPRRREVRRSVVEARSAVVFSEPLAATQRAVHRALARAARGGGIVRRSGTAR